MPGGEQDVAVRAVSFPGVGISGLSTTAVPHLVRQSVDSSDGEERVYIRLILRIDLLWIARTLFI